MHTVAALQTKPHRGCYSVRQKILKPLKMRVRFDMGGKGPGEMAGQTLFQSQRLLHTSRLSTTVEATQ
jgi:hypothetical protein